MSMNGAKGGGSVDREVGCLARELGLLSLNRLLLQANRILEVLAEEAFDVAGLLGIELIPGVPLGLDLADLGEGPARSELAVFLVAGGDLSGALELGGAAILGDLLEHGEHLRGVRTLGGASGRGGTSSGLLLLTTRASDV